MEKFVAPSKLLDHEFVQVIGQGGQGIVALYKNPINNEKIAVKFEGDDQSLLQEALLLQKICDQGPFPKYIKHSSYQGKRYLAMQHLDYSIQDKVQEIQDLELDEENKLEIQIQLMKEMLSCLRTFHDQGYVHRDIKPDNFRIHKDKVYLIDFGTAVKVSIDQEKEQKLRFKGTLEYSSIRCHQGKTPVMKDDLESFCYTLISIFNQQNQLPWMNGIHEEQAQINDQHHNYVSQQKQAYLLSQLDCSIIESVAIKLISEINNQFQNPEMYDKVLENLDKIMTIYLALKNCQKQVIDAQIQESSTKINDYWEDLTCDNYIDEFSKYFTRQILNENLIQLATEQASKENERLKIESFELLGIQNKRDISVHDNQNSINKNSKSTFRIKKQSSNNKTGNRKILKICALQHQIQKAIQKLQDLSSNHSEPKMIEMQSEIIDDIASMKIKKQNFLKNDENLLELISEAIHKIISRKRLNQLLIIFDKQIEQLKQDDSIYNQLDNSEQSIWKFQQIE